MTILPSERRPAFVPGIGVLLLAGLVLRLLIAYVFFPGSGFKTDLASFSGWALQLAGSGPGPFYAQAGFADYPPGYLYVLWLVGLAGQALAALTGGNVAAIVGDLIKLPAIFVDVGVAYLLYRVARGWRAGHRDAEILALGAAALYLFNPVTWYDSALWGQVDAFGALLLLGAILLLIDGQPELATAVGTLAGLVKPQYGVVLAPILGVIILRRHLARVGSGPRPRSLPAWLPAVVRRFLVERQGPERIVACGIVGVGVLVALSAPFSLDLPGLFIQLAKAAGGYPFLSVNAYNPWSLVGSAGQASLAAGGGWSPDAAGTNPYGQTFTAAQVGLLVGLPGVVIGTVLLIAGFLIGVVALARHDDRRTIVLVAAYLSLAFFILPTRVHERYLFPVFAILPLLCLRDRGFTLATLALAGASFVNLHAVLTVPLYATPNVVGLPFGDAFRAFGWAAGSAIVQTVVFLFALWRLRPRVDPLIEPGPVPARGPEPALEPMARPAAVALVAPPLVASPLVTPPVNASSPVASPEPLTAELAGPAPSRGSLIVGRLGSWWSGQLNRRPLRRDRSAELIREPGGRWDRLDLCLVIVLVVAGLVLRTWRLEEPYGMHFDEVYHARTATEFLQDWRYGEPHAIYEFTHPHLAKYLIAVGLVLFGDDRVTGSAALDSPVTDAAIEPRWSPPEAPAERDGDRLYVATGRVVNVYDLKTRAEIGELDLPAGAAAQHLALDTASHDLYVADTAGRVYTLPTTALDALRPAAPGVAGGGSGGGGPPLPEPSLLGPLGGPVRTLAVSADGRNVVAALADDRLVSVSTADGQVVGRVTDPGAAALVSLSASAVSVDPAAVDDANAVATRVTQILGGDAGPLASRLAAATAPVDVAAPFDSGKIQSVRDAIGQGDLPGVTVTSGAVMAVADRQGVSFHDAMTLRQVASITLAAGATGLALDTSLDQPTLYVASGRELAFVQVPQDGPPNSQGTLTMPGDVRDVRWDPASNLVHVLGETPDGSSSTIYVVEPHGNAVFADVRLPFNPAAWAMDANQPYPSTDRQQILALGPQGDVAVVDAGSHAFGWRFVGVLLGALMGGLIFLLARLLFRRRAIATIAGFLVLTDGMFFANSRIAMNDVYVNFFIVAAYVVFAAIYLGAWRGRSAAIVGLPAVGVLIGLACASKWVGFYALGGIVLLLMLRSQLGRWLALGGMVGLTALLGWLAIESPDAEAPLGDTTFVILMVGLTLLLAAAMILRPIRWSTAELRFAPAAPAVLGVIVAAVGVALALRPLLVGGLGLVGLGIAIWIGLRLAGRRGAGPYAPVPAADEAAAGLAPAASPPAASWLRPGALAGAPFLWALLCVTLLPAVVYVVLYTPWVALGNQFWPGFPAGNHGQTLWDLTVQMYNYHNDLRATHPATSPWWAWPFDLKPVWFYQESFANDTVGIIYDAGNLVTFWLAVPAAAWAAFQGWRRRSLPLLLLTLALACQWLPWARIDRATFQYHAFTSLPFLFILFAYFLDELWRGPSARTWALARLSAAAAILAVPLLWIGRGPLCWLADVSRVDPNSQACGFVAEPLVITQRVAISAIVLLIGAVAVAWQIRLIREASQETEARPGRLFPPGTFWLLLTVLFTLVALADAVVRFGDSPAFAAPLGDLGPALIAFLVGLPLAFVAWLVTRARDPRRFAIGILGAVGLWFVAFYPNIAGLPIPSGLRNLYSVLPLPTYNFEFQFAVNTAPAPTTTPPLIGPQSIALGLVVAVLAAAVMYAAWSWRLAQAEGLDEPVAADRAPG